MDLLKLILSSKYNYAKPHASSKTLCFLILLFNSTKNVSSVSVFQKMSNLDMSLDDMIKMNKASRSRAPTSGPGAARRFANRSASRSTPYSVSKARAPETQWNNSMFSEERAAAASFPIRGGARVSAMEAGTKLLISNLDFGVSDDDINELFSGIGDLKRCSVHYDRSGRSEGTAEVVFSRPRDAEMAIRMYNHVELDGKPMKIEIIGRMITSPPVLLPTSSGLGGYRNDNGAPIRNARLQGRGSARGMWKARGNGSGDARNNVSAEDLDADLDKYHAEAKETN